jgi:transcriptional regulator with XRE-family HTH domain
MSGIGRRIRIARKQAGLSQEALARRADMSLNGMASIERGEIADPHISTLTRIADALGVPVHQILEDPVPTGKA